MALIEGVGDEVTVLFGLLLMLLVLVLAWFSTHTVERGDPLFVASPPLATGQLGAEAVLDDRPSVQVSGSPQVKEEGEPSAGAESDGPGSVSGDLRHRTGLSPQPPLLPPGGTSAGSPPTDNTFVLRLKFLNDTERLARVHPEDTVGALKR